MDRKGFTLVELLVVITIIGILVSLTAVGVQGAREAARRAECLNNQRQLALAFNTYASANSGYPPSHCTRPQRGWAIELLPFLDEENFLKEWTYDEDYFFSKNRPLLQKHLPVFHCPSTPDDRRTVTADSDLFGNTIPSVTGTVSDFYVHGKGVTMYDGQVYDNPLRADKRTDSDSVDDGLSHTIVLNEQAGRPNYWSESGKDSSRMASNPEFSLWAGIPVTKIPDLTARSRIVNVNNNEFYGFHSAGTHAAFLDGSARQISKKALPYIILSLNTRNGGENVRVADLELIRFDASFINSETGLYPDGSRP